MQQLVEGEEETAKNLFIHSINENRVTLWPLGGSEFDEAAKKVVLAIEHAQVMAETTTAPLIRCCQEQPLVRRLRVEMNCAETTQSA